jgi:oligopeptidase B
MTTYSELTPPVAARQPYRIVTHGHERIDPYYWLREKSNPEVLAYLEAENAYTETKLAHISNLRERLYEEMVGRIQETDQTAPVPVDDYYYYSRTEKGKEYPIYCRKHGSLDAPEQVILDLNVIAQGHEYLHMEIFEVSPDHRLLAYSLDTSGYEDYQIYFKDLERDVLLPDVVDNVSYSAAWANDNATMIYTTQDHAKRSDKAWRHRLGEDAAQDEMLLHEPDELFRVYVHKTKDHRYLLASIASIETSEVHFLDADIAGDTFAVVQPRQKGMRYSIEHRLGTFYIITNEGDASNFKVMTTPVSAPQTEHWETFLAHRPDVLVEDMDLFIDHLVLYERADGLRKIRVTDLESLETHYVSFPEPVYTYATASNPQFATAQLRFTYQSMTTPESVYDYDMDTRERVLRKRKPVLGGYNPDDFRSERLFATAEDGTAIPISLVYKKSAFTPDAPMPCLLYGYGAYGMSMDPDFNMNVISLLERGMIFAIAHIRGGQEMGRAWYEQGKFLHKRNTFTDFIACARHLITARYTDPDHLAVMGGSAGGLLMGAVLNMAPDLFAAAIAAVPFVDVVTTMLDESIPLTVPEFEEWGNPKDHEYYDYMLSYSPYDNVSAQAYPDLLVTAGLNDPRVHYWEPAKWTAKLRDLKVGDSLLLLKTQMGAGHAGPSGRYAYLKERALHYAFLLDALGLAEAEEDAPGAH